MNRNREIIYYSFFFIFLFSCKQTEKTPISADTVPPEKKTDQSLSGNASYEAKITATVTFIDETRDCSDVQNPCCKAPCSANIKIEKIDRKGNLFRVPGNLSDVKSTFIHTLNPTTEDLFPNMGKYYPGLKINDKFEAIIASRPALNEDGVEYIIHEYKKIE